MKNVFLLFKLAFSVALKVLIDLELNMMLIDQILKC